ncbi:MAG: hypothetical protein EOM20_14555, partial [Spartobacteria bacterium]|nr:hypothetical protein [Spartobacteria bacterium]
MNSRLTVWNFFESLKSPRRLELLEEVAENVRQQLDEEAYGPNDPLAKHPELKGYAVYASDGHYEKPSAHAARVDGKKQPPATFMSANLRTHSLVLLDIARPKRKREHDMTALKRFGATQLRMGEGNGVKVIHAYDAAGIDYLQWFKWRSRGIYIISSEKENSKAYV